MRVVYIVSAENKQKAEDLLKKDDVVSRGSILIRSAGSLGFDEDGYFIIYDSSDESVKLADGLVLGIAKRFEKAKEVLDAVDEQESSAMEGFGNILG